MKMTPSQKGRAGSLGKKTALVLAAGFTYYAFVRLTGWGIPCVFYLASGKYCPGCGVSRMCVALLRLDFEAAFRANMLIMLLLLPGLFFGLRRAFLYIKTGDWQMDLPEKAGTFVALLLTLAFWLLRNLPQFAFLGP